MSGFMSRCIIQSDDHGGLERTYSKKLQYFPLIPVLLKNSKGLKDAIRPSQVVYCLMFQNAKKERRNGRGREMKRAEALFAALFIAQVKRDGAKDPVPHIPLLRFVDKRSHERVFFI
tara:strand:+ start:313 stop:663 length:351 start_codon:yes stop_codon:yes gene_type:complete